MADSGIEKVLGQSALEPSAIADVRETIDSSPYLKHAMSTAVEGQAIRRFALSDNPNEGGHYDRTTGTISINPSYFGIESKQERLDGLTAVIGHETGHALMGRSAEASEYRYAFEIDQAIREAVNNGERSVDITPFARQAVNDFRRNEGLAEMISMNSLASRVSQENGGFDMGEFLRRADQHTDYIDRRQLGPEIRLNDSGFQRSQGTIDSPSIERIAACHFDNGAKTLGLNGTSSYHDIYAAYALGSAAQIWKDHSRGTTQPMPLIEVDLTALGTSKQGVENAGIDLGGKGKVFDFIDLSNGQRRAVAIEQLGDGSKQQPDPQPAPNHPTLLADDPAHRDHGT